MAITDQTTAENELVGLQAKYDLLIGERNSLYDVASGLADKIMAARKFIAKGLTGALPAEKALRLADQALTGTGCDDCPGRSDCRCADGHTDTTDCTCPPQGGNS